MRLFYVLAAAALLPTDLSAQQFDPSGTWICQGGLRAKNYTDGYQAIAFNAVMNVYPDGTFERQVTTQGSAGYSQQYASGNWQFDGFNFYTSGVQQSSTHGASNWSDAIPVVSAHRMYKLQDLNAEIFVEQCDRQ